MAILSPAFHENKWAIFFCAVSTLGALCYGYDSIYYSGCQGMQAFINAYGERNSSTGKFALGTTFLSLTQSIIYVGELFGALISAPINDHFGRKGVFLSGSILIIAGAIAQVADNGSMGVIVAGRILIGLGIGNFTVTCVLYIGEVAPTAIRGPALMMFQFMQSCSQLVGSGITQGTEGIASTAAYRIPMGLLALLPLMMLVALPFIPESPIWLMRASKPDKATVSLITIHKGRLNYTPDEDLEVIRAMIAQELAIEGESSWISLVRDPIERRKVLYSCGAMFAQQINGIVFFYAYGVVFAQSIGIQQAFTISLITNILQVIAVGVSVVLGNRVPRRINLIVTTIIMFFSFIIVGALGTQNPMPHGFAYAIVVFSYIVIVAFNFGHGPLAYTVASEAACGRNRSKIMACSIVAFFFTVWLVGFTAPYMYYDAGLGPMLGFVYAGTTCITLCYVWFCVGETTGRTNLEVELFFQRSVPVREWAGYVFSEEDMRNSGNDDKEMGERGVALEEENCSI